MPSAQMMSPLLNPPAFSWMACPTISSVSFVLAMQVTSRQSRHPVCKGLSEEVTNTPRDQLQNPHNRS